MKFASSTKNLLPNSLFIFKSIESGPFWLPRPKRPRKSAPLKQSSERALPKRPAAWAFEKLDTLRHRLIQRAGRLTRPQGQLTLTMGANEAVRKDLLHFLDVLQKAA
jgi:hypothetical protein